MSQLSNYTLHPKRCTLTQRGFAPILLIALILIGITAATYLIQTRTNFLPQAASEKNFYCTPDNIVSNSGSSCPTAQKKIFAYCINKNDPEKTNIKNKIACDAAYNADPSQFYYVCNWDPPQCPQAPAATEYCALQGIRNPGSDTDIIISSKDEPWEGRDTQGNLVRYKCKGQNNLDVEILERAAPAAGSDYTPGVVGKCDDKQKHKENDPTKPLRCPPQPNSPFTECVVDKLETKSCVEPGKKDGDSCDASNCPAYEGTKKECKVVGGLPKCRYPSSAKDGACTDADKRTCPASEPYNEECWIYGTDYKYSGCRKKTEGGPATPASKPTETTPGKCPSGENGDAYCARETAAHGVESGKGVCYKIDDKARCAYALDYKSPDAANGPCNKKDNDSCIAQGTTCELVEVTLNITNNPKIKYSQCKAKTGQPAPRPAAGTSSDARTPAVAQPQTASGSQPRTQAGVAPVAADIICGKDDKGADIPCYAIGVFSPTELTSREAQAKIASVNYTKFRKIIDDEEKRIGANVANQARKQIAAAEEALKACIK